MLEIKTQHSSEYEEKENFTGSVLVVGAGIAGIQASLDLSASGYRVYLVEDSAVVGGRMARLDKTFPTGDCATCIISPKLVECLRDINIDILTLTNLIKIDGKAGNFVATLKEHPRYVDTIKCTGCSDCTEVCPVQIPSQFDEGMGIRKAIDKLYPGAAPNACLITKDFRAPCSGSCPIDHSIQAYVTLIAKKKYKEAAAIIRRENPLPSVCGRVCFHPCESSCNRGEIDDPVSICRLKRFALDNIPLEELLEKNPPTGKKISIVGSGPAGLAAAHSLALSGHQVIVFDSLPVVGGMLATGIPEYRLPQEILNKDINAIKNLGVSFKTNILVGKDISLEQLQNEYDATFIATGAPDSMKLNIPGEEASNVFHGVDFLRKCSLKEEVKTGKHVIVIGGGNVAIDVALTSVRLGADTVDLVCLETRQQMPAFEYEIEQALAEGVRINNSLGPEKILTNNNMATGIVFKKCTSVFDDEGKFNPSFDNNSANTFQADSIIIAIGQKSDLSFLDNAKNIHNGRIINVNNDTLETQISGIFAGGDVVTGPASVIDAINQGKRAAECINNYIFNRPLLEGVKQKEISPNPYTYDELYKLKDKIEISPRIVPQQVTVTERIVDFREVECTYTEEEALKEASRCLGCAGCCECKLCVETCKANAINHEQQERIFNLDIGAVILTPGFSAFNPLKRLEYGIGYYNNVITNLQFERILSASGPTSGNITRPSDNKHPKKLAFIQCVGSRDSKCNNDYCSSVCCMAATKEAIIAKEHEPGLQVTIFFMDLRAYGKDFDRYYERAKTMGIIYKRCRPAQVTENNKTNNLMIEYLDNKNQYIKEEYEMVVLSLGLEPSEKLKKQAEQIGISLNSYGFAETNELAPLDTSKPGIYVAGAFQEPKDIPDTVMQASGAASRAMSLLSSVRGTMIRTKTYPPERDVTDEPPRVGVFVCHCGSNIASVIEVDKVTEYAKGIGNVVFADHATYVCADDSQDMIKEKIIEHKLNRVIVASCTPRTHEPIFRDTLKSAGLNPYLLEMANIRDQCSWVHSNDPEKATKKAKDLVRMVAGRVTNLKELKDETVPVNNSALIIGGGIAGMTAAIALAEQGFRVHLVEKEKELGGNLRNLYHTIEGNNLQEFLQDTINKVNKIGYISVYENTNINKIEGHVGNFKSTLISENKEHQLSHGVVIVATGGIEKKPESFEYGKSDKIITQLELSGLLGRDEINLPDKGAVVMIGCVQQRDKEHPYCSRVCCGTAIKNALILRKKYPDIKIIILYRDIRTYGFHEIAYKEARANNIHFIRYEQENPPEININGNISCRFKDLILNQKIEVTPDLVVLASPIIPSVNNEDISELLRVPLNEDGFFCEAHVKLRPLDFASEGLFLCGIAHAPKYVKETISQANAVASRAATILSKKELPVSGQIAWVNQNKCISCMTCTHLCPYNAPIINKVNKAEIQGTVCMGCGSCTASCPAKAITLRHYADSQILGAINNLLLKSSKNKETQIKYPEEAGIAPPNWRKG